MVTGANRCPSLHEAEHATANFGLRGWDLLCLEAGFSEVCEDGQLWRIRTSTPVSEISRNLLLERQEAELLIGWCYMCSAGENSACWIKSVATKEAV